MFGISSIYFKIKKREYLKDIPQGLLILNWIIQRIFRVNARCAYSTNFTSKFYGNGANLILNGDKPKVSLALSGGCNFTCLNAKITIGDETIFANNVNFIADNHSLNNYNDFDSKSIVIGQRCWIGAGVTILPGVVLGNNVVVGANSVVTKSFEKNVVIAGNPAKIIKILEFQTEK